jgi:hypothetical protein
MRFQQMSLKICLLALCFASVSLSALAVPGHDQQALPPSSNVIACKILEVHANKEPGVVLVIRCAVAKREGGAPEKLLRAWAADSAGGNHSVERARRSSRQVSGAKQRSMT